MVESSEGPDRKLNKPPRLTAAAAALLSGLTAAHPVEAVGAVGATIEVVSDIGLENPTLAPALEKEREGAVRKQLDTISELLGIAWSSDTLADLESSDEMRRLTAQVGIAAHMRQIFIKMEQEAREAVLANKPSALDTIQEFISKAERAFASLEGVPMGEHTKNVLESELEKIRALPTALGLKTEL